MKPVVETMDGEQVSEASGGALGRAYEDLVGELKRDLDGKQSTALLNDDVSTFGVPDPRILICGCGGSGNNTMNRITHLGVEGAITVAINTDKQHLDHTRALQKLLVGRHITRGLGAGGDPSTGRKCAEAGRDVITQIVSGADLVFITAGLGGGTGTGSAHVIARLARAEGALTIAVVTYPFLSEGALRRQNAEWGLERLREVCDTVVVLPNERLLEVEGVRDLPLDAAFRVADELLIRSIAGVSEMISKEGVVNLDFQDLRSVMENGGGVAMIGLGEARGENCAEKATDEALESPLLDIDISDARGALVNVVGGPTLSLGDAEKCAQLIRDRINPYARIIWGATTDDSMGDEIRVLLVLTGVKSEQIHGAALHTQMRNLRTRTVEFVN